MKMPHGDSISIRDIVSSIESGQYRIPRFQRDFVWNIERSAGLIDSILRGYPIGSVILWKTRNRLNCIDKKELGGITIPGKNKGETFYIIDGQQRLTSLFVAVKGLTTEKGNKKQDFSTICVSLTAKGDEQIVYASIPKDKNPDEFVLLKDLYNDPLSVGSGVQKLNPKYYDILHDYDRILQQYMVSVIELDDEKIGLEQVVEIFQRLNLGGKTLTMFSIVAAKCYFPDRNGTGSFDLEEKLAGVNKQLNAANYGTIVDSTFLQMISACLLKSTKKKTILKKLNEKEVRDKYDDIEKAIFKAIDHLKGKNYGAVVSSLLPYERLLVPFVYFYYNLKKKQPTQTQENYLVDFYWRCVLGRRYNNAADTNMDVDLIKIDTILKGDRPKQESIVLSPKYIFENGRFQKSSSFVLGMLCLMAQNHPKSLTPGQNIIITNDALSKSVKKQYHHFFPQQSKVIQKNREYEKNVNNIVNIVLMDADTNNKISNKNPSKYIKEYAAYNKKLTNVLKSHYIPRKGSGIDNDDYCEFIKARSKELYLQLNDFLIKNRADTITDELPDFV